MHDVAQTQKLFAEKNIKFFLMSFVDMHGTPSRKARPRRVPGGRGRGRGRASPVLPWTGWGRGRTTRTCPASRRRTRRSIPLPWKPGLAWVAGNLQMDGVNWDYCPRVILTRALAEARCQRASGLKMGVEPEFFLVERKADGTLSPSPTPGTRSPSPAMVSSPCCGTPTS